MLSYFVFAACIPDRRCSPTGGLQPPTTAFPITPQLLPYPKRDVKARDATNRIDRAKRHRDVLFVAFAGICMT